MKKRVVISFVLLLLAVVFCNSCRTRPARKSYDPYLYKRGHWNMSKGGILDDIPQYLIQMMQSMFDYGYQPVDAPSEFAPRSQEVMQHAAQVGAPSEFAPPSQEVMQHAEQPE